MIELASEEHASSSATACPDCPAARVSALANRIPPRARACALHGLSVRARARLPARWFEDYGLALVRRGIVVRQRVDVHGRAIAIDAVGAGGLVPLGLAGPSRDGSTAGGYALGDALLCAYPADRLHAAIDGDVATARDIARLQAHALDRVERLADARGRGTVTARVAAMIGALADTLSPFRTFDVVPPDIQQIDLAALVSARQETVCRALGALERRALIARDDEGIRIVDRRGLGSV